MQHNFIDEALQGHGSADDFLQAMAEIDAFPEVREELSRYPLWVSDVIAVIDYDTQLQMEGLDRDYDARLIDALRRCSLSEEAALLKEITPDTPDDAREAVYRQLALHNDYDAFWDAVRSYIDRHL